MRPQAMGSNPLSVSKIFPYACPSVCLQAFCNFMSICLVIEGPFWTRINALLQWTKHWKLIRIYFQVESPMSAYICIYIYKSMNRDAGPLHGICICIRLQLGVQHCNVFIPQTGSSQAYVSVYLSLCHIYSYIFIYIDIYKYVYIYLYQ